MSLLLSIRFLLLVFTLHTLVVARSGKPPASFAVVKNNLLLTEYAWNLNALQYSSIAHIYTIKLCVIHGLNLFQVCDFRLMCVTVFKLTDWINGNVKLTCMSAYLCWQLASCLWRYFGSPVREIRLVGIAWWRDLVGVLWRADGADAVPRPAWNAHVLFVPLEPVLAYIKNKTSTKTYKKELLDNISI